MATVILELDPGESISLTVTCDYEDVDPDPGEEEEDDEYVDKTGTGDRVSYIRAVK